MTVDLKDCANVKTKYYFIFKTIGRMKRMRKGFALNKHTKSERKRHESGTYLIMRLEINNFIIRFVSKLNGLNLGSHVSCEVGV